MLCLILFLSLSLLYISFVLFSSLLFSSLTLIFVYLLFSILYIHKIHPMDLDPSKLVFTTEQKANFNEYVASTRIRAARNISGFSLPAGASEEDRAGVENVLQEAFLGLEGELAGKYHELGGLTDPQRDFLLERGFLFQIPTAKNLLTGAGAARSWPDNR